MFINWKMGIMRILYLRSAICFSQSKQSQVSWTFSFWQVSSFLHCFATDTSGQNHFEVQCASSSALSQWPWWMKASHDGTLSNKYVAQASDKCLGKSLTCWRRVIPSAYELFSHRKAWIFHINTMKYHWGYTFTLTKSSVPEPPPPSLVWRLPLTTVSLFSFTSSTFSSHLHSHSTHHEICCKPKANLVLMQTFNFKYVCLQDLAHLHTTFISCVVVF